MTIEEKISFLNQVKIILLDNNSWLDGTKEPIEESFDAAIKSLEAWGKVRAEIEEKMHTEISKHYDKESLMYHSFGLSDGLKDAIDIIDKHLAEVSE